MAVLMQDSQQSFPTCRTGGNHFSNSPAPPPPPFSSPPKRDPTSARTPPPPRTREPPRPGAEGQTSFWTAARVAGITLAVVLVALAATLGLLFFLCRKRRERTTDAEKHHSGPGTWLRPLISPVLKGTVLPCVQGRLTSVDDIKGQVIGLAALLM